MIEFFNKYLFGTAVPILLITVGIFYAITLKCFHIRHPALIIKSLTKKCASGGTSPFRAVTLALAGTLGVGNVFGVAVGIMIGGAGSLFWLFVSMFFAMVISFLL